MQPPPPAATSSIAIGEKGIAYAAKALACTTLDLLEDPNAVAAAKLDFAKRMEDRKFVTLIPPG